MQHQGPDPLERADGEQYLHTLPTDAAKLSRTGQALGYDLLRWGEKHGTSSPVAVSTIFAVRLTVITDPDRTALQSGKPGYYKRLAHFEAKRWTPWDQLSQLDRDFALSLLWIPEDPLSPLEALAEAQKDPI